MIKYRDGWIKRGSEAFLLWESKRWDRLEKHLARLRREAQARGEIL